MKMERRFVSIATSPIVLETREDGPPKISGLAAVYYDGTPKTEFKLWKDCVERIMPGAFARAIKEDDVRGLFNHDTNNLLGRTASGTLVLRSNKMGLDYEIDPGDTQVARDVTAHIKRGDLSGSSFSFRVTEETWREEGDLEIREINAVMLYDVGPVTFPAYEATTAGARAAGDVEIARRSHDAWTKSQKPARNAKAKARRARAVTIGL